MRGILLNLFFVINLTKCIERQTTKVKNSLPSFRRQVEEVPEEFTTEKREDESNINLVAFLVKNAKEIFGETEENIDTITKSSKIPEPITFPEKRTSLDEKITLLKETTLIGGKGLIEERNFTEGTTLNEKNKLTEATTFFVPFSESTVQSNGTNGIYHLANVTATTNTDYSTLKEPATGYTFGAITSITTTSTTTTSIPFSTTRLSTSFVENRIVPMRSHKFPTRTTGSYYTVDIESIRSKVLNIANVHMIAKGKKDQITVERNQDNLHDDIPIYNISVGAKEISLMKRSCIVCNNIKMSECNEPKNKMVPTVLCDNEEDICYTQQTPFGLIDRGCFNVNHNVTTYVCSCNLCNYISISDMPYMFSKRKDWLDNIIDLTRTRSFRSSIYKNMSCLSCEVNFPTRSTDLLNHVNCQEGNIGALSTIQCADDEICGVKAIKNKGYIWRGCIKSPLYNYWWSMCDSDFCNTDKLVSLYDDFR